MFTTTTLIHSGNNSGGDTIDNDNNDTNTPMYLLWKWSIPILVGLGSTAIAWALHYYGIDALTVIHCEDYDDGHDDNNKDDDDDDDDIRTATADVHIAVACLPSIAHFEHGRLGVELMHKTAVLKRSTFIAQCRRQYISVARPYVQRALATTATRQRRKGRTSRTEAVANAQSIARTLENECMADQPSTKAKKLIIIVVGDSVAQHVVRLLRASEVNDDIEIVYLPLNEYNDLM